MIFVRDVRNLYSIFWNICIWRNIDKVITVYVRESFSKIEICKGKIIIFQWFGLRIQSSGLTNIV